MINKQIFKNFFFRTKLLKSMWINLASLNTRFFLRFNPKVIANSTYKSVYKKDINWDNPTDLVEKTQWLQRYSDTSLWTICADKYLVRDFVKERGCGDVLNELYGMWYNADDIDWSMLPNSFVLKANHSCGQVLLVRDKNKLDKNQINIQLNNWMKSVYGYSNAQLHYTRIKPCIIAEKLLINKKESDKSLIDYKIWCFHGVPENILVAYNRSENLSFSIYDLEWNDISDNIGVSENSRQRRQKIAKPLSFDKMIEVAKKLSKDFPQVRVDFYDVDNEAIFGEMTFTNGFSSDPLEYIKYYGSKIDLSKVEKLSRPNTLRLFN